MTKNELVKMVEKFLEDNFEVSGDIQYHKLTDGRGKMITFKYGNEYFRYNGSKKSLKNEIVNFIKNEFEEKDLYAILNTAVKNFIDKNIK